MFKKFYNFTWMWLRRLFPLAVTLFGIWGWLIERDEYQWAEKPLLVFLFLYVFLVVLLLLFSILGALKSIFNSDPIILSNGEEIRSRFVKFLAFLLLLLVCAGIVFMIGSGFNVILYRLGLRNSF